MLRIRGAATGSAQRTRGEIPVEWKAPAFDLAQDSRDAVSSDGTIVGWGEVFDGSPHVRMASRLRLDPATQMNPPRVHSSCGVSNGHDGASRSPLRSRVYV